MGWFARARRRLRRSEARSAGTASAGSPSRPDSTQEEALWISLRENPNDAEAFHALAEQVRRRVWVSHQHNAEGDGAPSRAADVPAPQDLQQAMDDAVWSLAEELAHSGRAWYPLIELARLSLDSDREAALRRLGTAAERDSEGTALAMSLRMLRDEGMPAAGVNLATSRWRPREHSLDAARQVIESAIEASRIGDARRSLDALRSHPDQEGATLLVEDLEPLVDRIEARMPARTPAGGIPIVDLHELREASSRNPFRRSS